MSCWTYVTGVIEVDTCARSDAEAMYLAQTVVNHLARKEARSSTCHNRMVTVRRATLTNLTNPPKLFRMMNGSILKKQSATDS